ncbi:FAD-dependent monooxygenase [Sphingobacterium daejeonense]|uniref:FAD-dependent monooxygenase n=1 Tax=Sphingobacterium daejeonense TaxID=371142 RepID=UPI0021A3C717|nr:FAD-dependent monooxygenase [Sphingobacterium daejeonense]MCT1529608.1 FAD-dependent monooxygenase [Sphingobacterium daejeonense]
MEVQSEFTIIGGGVAGLTAAIALKNLNCEFHLFEQAKELKGIGAGFGLAANAMQALDYLGLRNEIENIGYYLDSFAILDKNGEILVNPNTKKLSEKYDQKNFAIHRSDLHLFLLSKIDQINISLAKRAINFKQHTDFIELYFEDGSIYRTKYLIIADGVKSPLRQQLIPDSKPRYAGYSCWRATIDNSSLKLQKGTETWGDKGRFGLTPLINDRIYWYACINGPRQNPTFKNFAIEDLKKQFSSYHHPIQEVLSQTKNEQLIWSDIIDIKPLNQFAFDNILIIGDAAHACTPNMGQGACQAMEDVAVLTDELQKNKSVKDAFKSFESRRLKRTKYITDTSKFIGEVAQWENKFLISIRNNMMKIMPERMNQQALIKLFKQDFMK